MRFKAVEKFRAKTQSEPTRIGRAFCLELTKRVVERTPVDTGRARANWQPTLNTIDFETGETFDQGGTVVPREAQGVLAGMKPGDEFTLANSLPYIGGLEFGSSSQAPAGMLGITIAEAPSLWREIAEGRR